MDFVLADPVQAPPTPEAHTSERVLRSAARLCGVRSAGGAPEVGARTGACQCFVTFGSLNNPAKLNDIVIASAARFSARVKEPPFKIKFKGPTTRPCARRLT